MSSEDEDDKFLYSDEEDAKVVVQEEEGPTAKKQKLEPPTLASGNDEQKNANDEESEVSGQDGVSGNEGSGSGSDLESDSESDSDIEIIIGTGTDTSKLELNKSQISTVPAAVAPVAPIAQSAGVTTVQATAEPVQDGQQEQQQTIDLNPDAEFEGKPIVEIDPEILKEKPWRQPGANLSDYFNYGFNEQTWMEYLHRQEHLRKEYNPQKILMNLLAMQQQGKLNDPSAPVPPVQNQIAPPMGLPSMFGGFPGFPFPGMMNNMPNQNMPGMNMNNNNNNNNGNMNQNR